MVIVQKALSIGSGSVEAPAAKVKGDALQPSNMKPKCKKCGDKLCNCVDKSETLEDGSVVSKNPMTVEKCKVKKMSKDMYKSNLVNILDKLQVLYPQRSRSEIWEAVKERLDTKFEKGIRIKNTSGKEHEHQLYEHARQRGDYEENKDKSKAELSYIAKQSGLPAKEKEQIRSQHDAAIQVGDRDHVRPNVKG